MLDHKVIGIIFFVGGGKVHRQNEWGPGHILSRIYNCTKHGNRSIDNATTAHFALLKYALMGTMAGLVSLDPPLL